jgi:hypothetical protein
MLGLMALASGCGGDDEPEGTTAETVTTETAKETEATETATETETTPTTPTETETTTIDEPPSTSPEDQPGGAGDEEAARTLALFTGRYGRIGPGLIRVPAFISVRVELRSADGRKYGLDFDGKTLKVGGGLASMSTTFDGLRPGEVLLGLPIGGGNPVRVAATAEPGP